MTQRLDSDRSVYMIGGVSAIVGSVLAGVGNLLHPVAPIDDGEGVAEVIAQSDAWGLVHMIIVFGILLMLGGLVSIRHSLREGLPGVLTRFGLAAGIVGIAVGIILVILDGVGAKQLADEWAIAPPEEQVIALRLVLASESLNFAIASSFNIVFAGATFLLYGLAIALADTYPRWLGWVAAAAAILSIAAGLIQAFTGEPTLASRLLTIIGPTVITLWLLTMGILLMQRAKSTDDAVVS